MITEAQFAARLALEIRKLGIEDVHFDPPHFRLRLGAHQLSLRAAFADYQQATFWRKHEVIRSYVESVRLLESGLPDFAAARGNLLPRLRERRFYEGLLLRGTVSHIARTPFSENFFLELVYDAPRNIVSVDRDHLASWGVGFQEAMAIAVENLRARSRQPWHCPAIGVYVSPWRDNHAASRLALSDVIRGMRLKGDPVAVAPHRDLLVVTGSLDVDGLALLAHLVEASLQQPRLMSTAPLRFDGQRWTLFESAPPETFNAIKKLRVIAEDLEYREQKQVLDSLEDEPALHIANYQVDEGRATGRLQSFCMWDENRLPALLPRTDLIVFVDRQGRRRAPVAWELVEEMVGPMRIEGMYPERWRIDHFPRLDDAGSG